MAKWPKGVSGNVRGRPRGTKNHATRDIQAFSRAALTNERYVSALLRRLERGDAPHMETLLHYYAYGKPRETVDVLTVQPRPLVVELLTPDGSE